jgi:hypothetical protein
MRGQIRRVGIGSCVKIFGLFYAVVGILVGGMFSLFALLGAGQGLFSQAGPVGRLMFGVASIILFPLLYAAIGAITGVIGAAAYNVAADLVGGIELEFDDLQSVRSLE